MKTKTKTSYKRKRLASAAATLCCACLCRRAAAGWIDTDTPKSARSVDSITNGRRYELVMSDEFEKEGRNFGDGQDPKWTAINKNDYTNAALHYYSKDLVTTSGGKLNITTVNEDVTFRYWEDKKKGWSKMSKTYKSGMLQGWDKFCFSGGIVEVSAALPGDAYTGGLWPAIWLLGNLARATYTDSSDYQWPWSYSQCDRREHPDFQLQQEVSACNVINHYGLHSHQGRGAPEIDILEAMAGRDPINPLVVGKPYISTSFQVSPGTEEDRPVLGRYPDPGTWYEDELHYGANTSQNLYFFGTKLQHEPASRSYWADAISANHQLKPTHFRHQHVYRLEWVGGTAGHIRWYIDGAFVYGMSAATLRRTGATLPLEPMYLLFNTAVSSMWGFPAPCNRRTCGCNCWDARRAECQCAIPKGMADLMPASFLIDWVRVYQDPEDPTQTVGCDTPAMPTSKWIRGHSKRYMDPGETMYKRPVPHGGGWCYSDPSEAAAAAAASAATAPALNVSRSSNSGKAKSSGSSGSNSPTAAAAGHRRATEELSPSSSSSSSSDLPFPASWYDTVSSDSDSSSSSSDSDSDAAAQDSGASRLDSSSSSSSSSDAAQKRKRKKHADDAAAANHHSHADSRTDKADSSATSSMGGGGSGSSASCSEDAEHERAWWERMGHSGESRELDCGGGSCVSNRCVCPPAWSGPHCRAPNGFDDAPGADGQKGASLPLPPSPPLVPRVFAALFALLCLGFGATLALRTSHRLSGRAYANLDDILPLVPMHNPLLDEQGLFERTDCHSSPLPALALQRS